MKQASGIAESRISGKVAREALLDAYRLEKEAGELLLLSDEAKDKVSRYLSTKNLKHLDAIGVDNNKIRLQLINRATVKYNIALLKKRLNKKVLKEIINKKCEIIDFEKFVQIMKSRGISPGLLSECLKVTESVDNKRVNELFESGHIELKHLEGAYTLEESITKKIKEL